MMSPAHPWVQPPQHHFTKEMEPAAADNAAHTSTRHKRKAELAQLAPESNERLSKRLSLLNLEHGGTKLYVPVETPQAQPIQAQPTEMTTTTVPTNNSPLSPSSQNPYVSDDDSMRLDDSKHKVYIYNIDDELSSDSDSEDGRLVFLPDIERHLRKNRIPPIIMAKPDTDFVGKELVLYSDPTSLSVPEEKDSVRKAIVEARARVRKQQEAERKASEHILSISSGSGIDTDTWGQSQAGPAGAAELSNRPNAYSQGPFAQAPPKDQDISGEEMDLD